VFTALLLADMARDGLVKMDDPVAKFLPESAHVPTYQEKEITLVDLATHTSGLPRMPDNFVTVKGILSGNLDSNPYVDYTPKRLYSFLSSHKLAYKPGTRTLYSNLGMGLLGHALSLAANTEYEQLVCSRICRPLGMDSTAITVTADLRSRLAQGHISQKLPLLGVRIRQPAHNWDIPTLAGAGALRSTGNDLLKFLAANLGTTKTPLDGAIEATHLQRYRTSDNELMALAWIVYTHAGEPEFWHNGGTGGYASFMGFRKQRRAAVVVLTNTSSSVDIEGSKILELLSKP
jgi:CubicO group peptidase (beta-lactamase class C family)